MAYSTTPVDINRGTSNLTLPPDLAAEVIAKTVETSAVMQLAPKVNLPGRGLAIPVILGNAEAAWVAESTEKPVGEPTLDTKIMQPYTLSVILMFSNQLRRDWPALYDELVKQLPGALAAKFDETVLNGTAPGSGFDVLTGAPAITIDPATGVWGQLVAAKSSVATAGGSLNGWIVSPMGEAGLLGATDQVGRPLLLGSAADGGIGRILGAPVLPSKGADDGASVRTVAGDWSMARWGIVGDIQIDFTDSATINDGSKQVNLWQRNMFAVRCEAEFGFVCADDTYFVRLDETEDEGNEGN